MRGIPVRLLRLTQGGRVRRIPWDISILLLEGITREKSVELQQERKVSCPARVERCLRCQERNDEIHSYEQATSKQTFHTHGFQCLFRRLNLLRDLSIVARRSFTRIRSSPQIVRWSPATFVRRCLRTLEHDSIHTESISSSTHTCRLSHCRNHYRSLTSLLLNFPQAKINGVEAEMKISQSVSGRSSEWAEIRIEVLKE